MWWNFIIKFPINNLKFFPFDAREYELYAHWAIEVIVCEILLHRTRLKRCNDKGVHYARGENFECNYRKT